jgi:hypothetical protein
MGSERQPSASVNVRFRDHSSLLLMTAQGRFEPTDAVARAPAYGKGFGCRPGTSN